MQVKIRSESLHDAEPGVQELSRLEIIESRGTLRVGFLSDSLPFAVRNHAGEVVGFDIEISHHLATNLGVVQSDDAFVRQAALDFPNATIDIIKSPRTFLRGELPDIDAIIYAAERGSAWTLIYPEFAVTIPHPLSIKIPMGYPLPRDDPRWTRYVSKWINYNQKIGTIDNLFEHWISGAGASVKTQRWSVIRDVLHWVE